MEKITYCFVSPYSTVETVDLIQHAFAKVGRIVKVDANRGRILGKFQVSPFRSAKMEFYVQRSDTNCKVRMVILENLLLAEVTFRNTDKWWDKFLLSLQVTAPDADFGVTTAGDGAFIVGVQYLGSDVIQTHSSVTTGGSSLLGFLAGGAVFGAAGAIVGGMSGSQRTFGSSRDTLTDKQIAKVIYNNGRYWEGVVKKDSKIYNEIMVNL